VLIDVMIPYYGDVGLLKLAVRSVLAQRHRDLRLVVVDDLFPDAEPRRWFARLGDPRVHYRRNESNLGVNGNFQRCVDLVRADVFVVMGSDDVMLAGYLEAVARAYAEHPGAAVVATGVEVIDGDGAVVRPLGDRVKGWMAPRCHSPVVLSGERLAASLLRGNWTYFPSLAWRTRVVRGIGFRPGLEVVLDMALLLDIAARGGLMVFDPVPAFQYRRHPASVSSLRAVDGLRFVEERAFFDLERRSSRERGWPRAARAARWHPTSRLNALSLLPAALARRQWRVVPGLLRHVAG